MGLLATLLTCIYIIRIVHIAIILNFYTQYFDYVIIGDIIDNMALVIILIYINHKQLQAAQNNS